MSRALLTLVGGVVVAFLAVALLTPGVFIASRGFALVLLTVLAGAVVMAVVVRRTALRDEAQRLTDRAAHPPDDAGASSRWTTDVTDEPRADDRRTDVDEEMDRG